MELVTPGFGLIFWSTLTFLAVLLVLSRFVWQPIMSALKSREASIEDALQAAELAREERDQLLKEASKIAARIKNEAKEEASKVGDKMIEEARLSIESEKHTAIKEIKNQVAELSLQITERLLKKNLSKEKEQKELINEYIKDLKLN